MNNQIIILEVNEIAGPIMDRFMAEGKLPALERMKRESGIFSTTTDSTGALNPWVQWVSFNHGISATQHCAKFLGDDSTVEGTPFWDIGGKGRTSVVQFPMNGRYSKHVEVFVSDLWSESPIVFPEKLKRFYEFSRSAVHSQPTDSKWKTLSQGLSILPFLTSCSLGPKFFALALRQVLLERVRPVVWNRVCLFEKMSWRVFSAMCSSHDVQLGVYFSNTIAYLQHRYWHFLQPELFDNSLTKRRSAPPAILTGYLELDGEISELERRMPDATIVLVSALGQVPHLNAKVAYVPKSIDEVIRVLKIPVPLRLNKLMAEQFRFEFESQEALLECQAELDECHVGTAMLFQTTSSGTSMLVKCGIHTTVELGKVIDNGRGVEVPFFELFTLLSVKTGQHDETGILWIREPERQHYQSPTPIPLVDAGRTLKNCLKSDPRSNLELVNNLRLALESNERNSAALG
ncbi:hypothetical protein NZK35_08840 [Stieleria sp. ICT_E10.1]|uniref:hypothetical protein n=1 Tax=Stieleria sedimenti TaxID=2976331 RepID=UPI00217F61F8|nr:hypothetical protein [Stieleria sedimenti]MCS7466747.1 hypothetical protein [Stieleria sedimenti]